MLSIQTVLFPTDDSPSAEAARAVAEALAQRHGAALHVLHVEVVPPVADLRFDPLPRGADPAPVPGGSIDVYRRFPTAGDAIVEYANEADADLIVMGTHGRSGFNRFTLGSTAEHVLRRAPCPVLTVGPEAEADLAGPILAPLAFESASDVALETGAALAADRGTRLLALHVVEPVEIPVPYLMTIPPFDPTDLTERVERTLRRWVSSVGDGLAPIDIEVRHGDAVGQILDAARERGAALIVQASHGRRGIGRWLLGSVAEAVVRRAPCPVLTLRIGSGRLVRPGDRPETLGVPRADWASLFDALSNRAKRAPHAVSVEVVSPEAEGLLYDAARLVGITYDGRDDAVEVLVEGGEHHVVRPFAVRSVAGAWTLDAARDAEAPGPWTLEVVRADGTRERISIRPVGESVPA